MSADLRTLTRVRLRESRVLLQAGETSGAYYLCGYAVECGLKACITRQFARYQMPGKKLVEDSHTHNLEKLVRLSGLEGLLRQEANVDSIFENYWNVTKDWNETSRYEVWPEQDAQDLYRAVSNRDHGVLRWIRRHW